MTWTKLSDDFTDDCSELSAEAFRLHVEGLVWSNRKLLDLRIDKARMARWVWNADAADIAVKELVATGWWSDEGDHYVIRHHACYQRTREQVLKQQETNRANRAKGKARPVREQANNFRGEDESSDASSDERDGTGQDRTGHLREAVEVPENGSVRCRYCETELRESMKSQRQRGFCNSPDCLAEAKEEMS